MSVELYGPQADVIQRMIDRCDTMTDDELRIMSEAFTERRRMVDDSAWRAAESEGVHRVTQAGKCGWDVEISLKSNGFNRDPEVIRLCGWAVQDAALAISTRDLIGAAGYFVWDFDKLMYPWRAAIGDPA